MSQAKQPHQPDYRTLPNRVFLSSTSKDLSDHRARVTDTLLRLDQLPVDMAYFGAWGDGDAAHVSLTEVENADIYILLIAWRYGTILPHETRSITHLEYLEALRQRQKRALPIFIFLADDSTRDILSTPDALFPASVRDPEHWEQLLAFRAEVGASERHVGDIFTTPDDLGRKVATALTRELLHRQYVELTGSPRIPQYLPPLPPGFVGREHELDDLCTRLRTGTSVGLSAAVSGMAGVGKSALAAQALHHLAAEIPPPFPGGIAWVACNERTGTTGLAWIYDQLLGAWGTPLTREEAAEADGNADPARAREQGLQRHFATSHPGEASKGRAIDIHTRAPKLVLLDNVEEALPLARALTALGSAGITTLVTARHRPALPALSLIALDTLEHEPDTAVTLFAERYTQAGGDWDATRDMPAAQRIIQLLGYLPLAIELAAAGAIPEGLSVASLAAEAQEADRLGQLRDPLDPTRSVRYAFERSIATLSDEERHCFTALGMLAIPDAPRSLVLDLCAQLLRPTDQDEAPHREHAGDSVLRQREHVAASCLSALAARSLISQVTESEEATEPVRVPRAVGGGAYASTRTGSDAAVPSTDRIRRIRVHPLLHDFAQATWRKTALNQRIADVMALLRANIRYSETASKGVMGDATHRRFAAMERDENVLVNVIPLGYKIYEHATLDAGANVSGDAVGADTHSPLAALIIRLVSVLHEYITLGGHWRLGIDLRLRQLQLRREAGDRRGEGTTLNNLGYLANNLGRKEEALDYYRQALAIRRDIGDRSGEGTTLNNLGSVASSLGRKEEALDYFQQALAIRRDVGDRSGEGTTLNNLGRVASGLGRMREALDYYQHALAIRREAGDRRGEGTTLNNLGRVADDLGRAQEALGYHQQALAIRREVGDRRGEGTTLNNLGRVASNLGRKEEALDYHQRALVISREVGNRRSEGTTYNNLGSVASSLGRKEEALEHYQQALAILREVGDRGGEGTTLNNLGSVADDLGRAQEALAYYRRALAILQEVGDRRGAGTTLNNLGLLMSSLGRKEEALDYYQQALAIIDSIEFPIETENIRDKMGALQSSIAVHEKEQAAGNTQRKWRWLWQRRDRHVSE